MSQSMNPMLGVQNNELIEYNNIMKNIISNEYLQQVHPITGDVNKTDEDGFKAIGSIDFQPYEIDPQFGNTGGYTILVSNQSVVTLTISDEFDVATTIDDSGDNIYVWDKVVDAVKQSIYASGGKIMRSGSNQPKKVKGEKNPNEGGKYLKKLQVKKDNQALDKKAKDAGYKTTQDYVNVQAVRKGGLGT